MGANERIRWTWEGCDLWLVHVQKLILIVPLGKLSTIQRDGTLRVGGTNSIESVDGAVLMGD